MKPLARRWCRLALLAVAMAGLHLVLLGHLPVRPSAPPASAGPYFFVRWVEPPITAAPLPPPAQQAALPAKRMPVSIEVNATPRRRRAADTADEAANALLATSAPGRPAAPPEAAPGPPPQGVAQAVAVAAPMRLHYEARARTRGIELAGQGELLWRHDGHAYEARLALRGPFLPTRVQRSIGQLTPQGLAPTRFSDRKRSEQAVHFERARGELIFSNNSPRAALAPGTQDRLSVLLQLGALLAARPDDYKLGDELALRVAGTNDVEMWHFRLEGEDTLRLPGGSVRALRLVRLPRKPFDQRVELWLAPEQAYAPVRLRLTQANGDWMEQQWSGTDRP